MNKIFRLIPLLLLCVCCCTTEAVAQRNRKKTPPPVSVDSLIKHYRFEEAIAHLEQTIEDADSKKGRRAKKIDRDLIASQLEYARKAQTMLYATEKVAFLDSMVVPLSQLVGALSIDKEAGRIDSLATLIPELKTYHSKSGKAAYVNELADRAIFAVKDADDTQLLYTTECIAGTWANPRKANGLIGKRQDFPFFLSDGITLYYAAEDTEGLGGYDIYVAQYDAEENVFRTSENLGMPFNSPANDYLCIIDETRNIGWLATDRRQPADSVCIYTFIPTQTRTTYDPILVGEDALRNYAQILCLKDSQADLYTRTQTNQRLKKLSSNKQSHGELQTRYIVDDATVYHHPALFRSDIARTHAIEWGRECAALEAELQLLEEKRIQLMQSTSPQTKLKSEIIDLEKQVLQRLERIKHLAAAMRQAEIEYTKK